MMWKPPPCMEDTIQDSTPGQWRKGRPQTSGLGNITAWLGLPLESVIHGAADHIEWTVNE